MQFCKSSTAKIILQQLLNGVNVIGLATKCYMMVFDHLFTFLLWQLVMVTLLYYQRQIRMTTFSGIYSLYDSLKKICEAVREEAWPQSSL